MSFALPLDKLSEEVRNWMIDQLTFSYEKKQMLKGRGRKEIAVTESLVCYREINSKIHVPAFWAKDILGVVNNHGRPKMNYNRILGPRDEKQSTELDSVIKVLTKERTVALTLRTGAGKTAVSLFTACHFKGMTVVLLHNSLHCQQWMSSVKKYTNAKAEIIEKDTNGIDRGTNIIICLYTRWVKVPKSVREKIDLLIIDECDQYCNETGMDAILAFEADMVMGCTATFKRPHSGLESMMQAVLGNKQVSRAFDVDFTVTKMETGIQGIRIPAKHTYGPDWLKLKHSLLYNPERNLLIVDLVKVRLKEGKKILIISTEVNHVGLLHEMISKRKIKGKEISCDFLSGKKKSHKNSSVLIVCAKKGGRGYDEESFCPDWDGVRINCVMIVDFVNNETDLLQWMGRGFRADDCDVDMFVDDDKTIEKQWKNNKEICERMGATIKKCTFE